MDSCFSSIQALVSKLKKEVFSRTNDKLYSFVSPSAYDTAWLAMVPHPVEHDRPMFKGCLEWLINNQKEQGYWGESMNGDHLPTIDALPATLASMAALRKWGVGAINVEKGLKFIHAHMEEMLRNRPHCSLPRWFTIVFPATVEVVESCGLQLKFSVQLKSLVSQIIHERQLILDKEGMVDKCHYPPLLAYIETFQSTTLYDVDQDIIMNHLSEDGSLFQSPSATAHAFIATGNQKCLSYLKSLVQKCPNGVPSVYPMDEELVKLSMGDQVQKLGLSEYFTEEIQSILRIVYKNYMNQDLQQEKMNFSPSKLYKDALAFRLFRLHGYYISPSTFCWFLYHDEIMDHLEKNCQNLASLLYTVFRATDLMFFGETEVDEARSFSQRLLKKTLIKESIADDIVMLPNLSKVIEAELSTPWIARLDHLDHRMWIEQNKESPLWTGKASYYRLSCVHSEGLMQLAVQNYAFRQLIYQNELQELKRWSKKWGLTEMGFGREKTMYCYFAVAASTLLPHDSIIRMLVAKSAILITVADDFFDMKGSLEELQVLMEAILRWDGKGLSGPSKTIFDVLDDLVRDSSKMLFHYENIDVTEDFRDLWRETFQSWLTETTWGKIGYIPSVNEYLQTGMVSIATHILVLTASCFLKPGLPKHKLKTKEYEGITRSLMATTRLLNDIQSYQKEQEEGKMNLVLLHYKQNTGASMEDSIAHVEKVLEGKRKEFLKYVFVENDGDFSKQFKLLHLSCFKVFQMLFNTTNRYDSDTDLELDIKKAIYVPPKYVYFSKDLNSQTTINLLPTTEVLTIINGSQQHYGNGNTSNRRPQVSNSSIRNVGLKVFNPPVLNMCLL